jgi:hypothetical protein
VVDVKGKRAWAWPFMVFGTNAIAAYCFAGILADELGDRVGSPAAVRGLLEGAGLSADVAEVEVDIPWPGAAAFVDYRLATVGVAGLVDDPAAVRREAIAAVTALPAETLPWSPRLVLGAGRR